MNEKHPGGTMKQTSGLTKSQYLPVNSDTFRKMSAKAFFWPGVITCIAVILLYSAMDSTQTFGVDCICKVPTGRILPDHTHELIQKIVNVQVPIYLMILGLYVSCGLGWAAYRMIGRQVNIWVLPVVATVTGV